MTILVCTDLCCPKISLEFGMSQNWAFSWKQTPTGEPFNVCIEAWRLQLDPRIQKLHKQS